MRGFFQDTCKLIEDDYGFTYVGYSFFILTSAAVLYLLIFALLAQRKKPESYPLARKQHRVLVLFPAYKEDKVIVESVRSFLEQEYPRELYRVVVVSDKMQPETDEALKQLPVELINARFENSSKAAPLTWLSNSKETGSTIS